MLTVKDPELFFQKIENLAPLTGLRPRPRRGSRGGRYATVTTTRVIVITTVRVVMTTTLVIVITTRVVITNTIVTTLPV